MRDDFEMLVRRHQWAVCASAYAVLRDRARSEEIAQEAFLLAWQKLPEMVPPPVMPGWICGIARNLARNAAKKRREVAAEVELATTATPLDDAIDRETLAEVARAVGDLEEHDRDVLVLYYRGEQSLAEVATILEITEGTARKRLQRGRDRLRDSLATVETALRATRPGPAFTLACVAALAAGAGVHTAAASTVARGKLGLVAIGAAALVAIGGAAWWTRRATRVAPDASSVPTATTATSSRDAALATTTTMRSPALVRKLDPTARAAVVAQLAEARTTVTTTGTPDKTYDFAESVLEAVPAPAIPPTGPLSKTTIRHAIHGIQPFLLECAAASHARGRDLRGALEVKLRLSGAPDVGTLVESAELGGAAVAAADPELVTCLTETLLSLELAPMDQVGIWVVDYPFVVR